MSNASAFQVRYGLIPLPYLPYSTWDGTSASQPSGFIVDVLTELGHYINWDLKYVPTGVGFATGADSYLHNIRQELADGVYDLAMLYYDDPNTGFGPTLGHVSQSVAFHTQIHTVGIEKIEVQASLFALFDPFTPDLWLGIILFSLAYGFVLQGLSWIASKREGAEVPRPSMRETAQMQYHSLAMVLAGEDFDMWRTAGMRLARLSMLLFVLVFGATYTANLAAFFTKPNFRLVGPKAHDELAAAHVCIQQSVVVPVVEQSVGSYIVPPMEVQMAGLLAMQRYCAKAVLDGTVEAMVSLVINLREFLDKGGCANISHVSNLDFAPVPFQFGYVDGAALPAQFGEQLDTAIVKLMRSPKYAEVRAAQLKSEALAKLRPLSPDTACAHHADPPWNASMRAPCDGTPL